VSRYVSVELRQLVKERAAERCEYCRFPQAAALMPLEVEHIVAEKHGGKTAADNLALACFFCNRYKGSDLGSLDPETGQLTLFFHPRQQQWADHFRIAAAQIVPLTAEARVTVRIFRLNDAQRIAERRALIDTGMYP
jgi:hypothetical protein